MAKKEEFLKVITPEFRVSFPQVFEAKSFEGQAAKFSIQMLFDKKQDIGALKSLAKKAAERKFPSGIPKDNFRWPFRDGDSTEHESHKGMIFCNAKSNASNKPEIVDRNREPIIDQADFYGGCYAVASIGAYGYDHMGNRGVAFSLLNVMKVKDGKPFGGRVKAEDEFKDVQLSDDDFMADDSSDDDMMMSDDI